MDTVNTKKRLIIKKDASSIISSIIIFVFLLFTFLFNHTIFYQVGLILLCLWSLFTILVKHRMYHSKFFLLYILFLFFCFIQIYFIGSYNVDNSEELLQTLCINFIAYYFIFNLLVNNFSIKKMFKMYVITIFVCTLLFLMLLFNNGKLTFSNRIAEDVYIYLFGIKTSYNSNSIAMFSYLSFAIVLLCNDDYGKIFRILSMAIFTFVVLLSGSRRALFLIIFTILMYYLKKMTIKNFFIRLTIICVAFVLLYFLIMKVNVFYSIIGVRVESLLSFYEGGNSDSSIVTRFNYITIGRNIFFNHPWFGIGLGNFKDFANVAYYSHNDYIELLSGVGLIGTLLCYAGKIYICKEVIKLKNNPHKFLYIVLCVILLLSGMATVSYYKREDWLIWIFVLAAIKSDYLKKSYE